MSGKSNYCAYILLEQEVHNAYSPEFLSQFWIRYETPSPIISLDPTKHKKWGLLSPQNIYIYIYIKVTKCFLCVLGLLDASCSHCFSFLFSAFAYILLLSLFGFKLRRHQAAQMNHFFFFWDNVFFTEE
jgi:hypothetical protein